MDQKELDIRSVSPKERRELIYKTLDTLGENDSLRIIINHNPAPLIGMINRERRGFYGHRLIEEGPDVWRLEFIRKSLDYTIAEIIDLNPSSVGIFEKYDIPYYYLEDKKISDFLRNRFISFSDFVIEALKFNDPLFEIFKPWEWSAPLLIDFILENHHTSLVNRMTDLKNMINTLGKNHGGAFPLLQVLHSRFEEFMAEQKEHLNEEERSIFPAILSVVRNPAPAKDSLDSLNETINWMIEEHHTTVEGLHSIRKICNNYLPPDESIPGILHLFNDLKTFEKDYHYHLLLENHYLPQSLNRSLRQ
jgi:regulator of cell morphogenesis and NO signaling